MFPPSGDEWWKIDEPDDPDEPHEPVTLANALGTLYNSEWPFKLLQVPRPESPMSLQDAVLNSFMNFWNFSGRATRSEFWWFQLFFFANLAFFGTVFGEVFSDGYDILASALFFAPLLVPSLAVTFRRIQDLGYPGWISLGVFIPYMNFWFTFVLMVLLAYQGEDKPNKYGEAPVNVRIMALPKTD